MRLMLTCKASQNESTAGRHCCESTWCLPVAQRKALSDLSRFASFWRRGRIGSDCRELTALVGSSALNVMLLLIAVFDRWKCSGSAARTNMQRGVAAVRRLQSSYRRASTLPESFQQSLSADANALAAARDGGVTIRGEFIETIEACAKNGGTVYGTGIKTRFYASR